MSAKRPPPPPPPAPPGVAAPETPTPPPDPPHSPIARIGPVVLVIRGEVTIPATPGYAKRLGNLIEDVKRSVVDQAPWLRNITVEVER